MEELTIKKADGFSKPKIILRNFIVKSICFTSAFMASQTKFLENYYPFGLSLAACGTSSNLLWLTLGAILGYFTLLQTSFGFRYIATTIAISLIYWSFSDFKKIRENNIFKATSVFLPTLITGIIMNSVCGLKLKDVATSVLEAIISTIASIYLSKSLGILHKFLHEPDKKIFITESDFLCILLSISTILACISKINILGILSIGKVISIVIIMICSNCFGAFGGCISAVITGTMFSLSNFGVITDFFAHTISGTTCGLFKKYSHVTQCAVFTIISVFCILKNTNLNKVIIELYEIVVSSTIFLCISTNFTKNFPLKLTTNNYFKKKTKKNDSVNTENLENFSKKLLDIPIYLEKIASELDYKKFSLSAKKEVNEKFQCVEKNLKEEFLIAEITLKSMENFFKRSHVKNKKKPTIAPCIGAAQHFCKNGNLCGDSYETFFDEDGNFNVILSDGMGTGENAAAEGTMVSELLKKLSLANIKCEDAVKWANYAFNGGMKSNESCVAIDVLKIDCYTGLTKFVKAGAAPSFIKRGNEVRKLNFSSLPIGILDNTNLSKFEINLKVGDKILMLTDGVSDCGEEWIFKELSNWNGEDLKDFSQKIVNTASKIRENTYDDDITAILVAI